MRKFIAIHFGTGLKMTFQYDLNGVLRILEFDGDWSAGKVERIKNNLPSTTEAMIEHIKNQNLKSGWVFQEVSDISFAYFYKQYPRSVGPKELTEKAFNKLGDVDKMEAILYIPELIRLKGDGTAFPYPASYLNKKYWK